MKRIITIAGMPGSGKSWAARELAAQLSASGQPARWIDLDAEVERRAGKAVARIFAEDGEAAFRSLEKECLMDILEGDFSTPSYRTSVEMTKNNPVEMTKNNPVEMAEKGTVEHSSCHVEHSSCHVERSRDISFLALGGGTLEDPENLELVKKNSYCIWLDTPIEVIAERLWEQGAIDSRPLLASAKTKKELTELLKNLYETRKANYQAAAKEVR
ncbi:MAG: hypothetical protein IJ151_02265 [Bacteroidales bacterium]|nr:hypothetical protein [Bacteroidales bacterium]